MDVLAAGKGEFKPPDPEGMRAWVREHKVRAPVDKLLTEQEAISRFVNDGDYMAYDMNVMARGPSSLFREIIRQRKKDLWIAAKFSWADTSLLVAGGCVNKVDVGWMETGAIINKALQEDRLKMIEWSNGTLTYRLLAGALGVPFLPMRWLGGTDVFEKSGAKLVEDPYTGQPIVLVPALNPDVALIHVHECDVYGNARIFGAGVAPQEIAMASKKVIISTEQIISNEEIRQSPQRTTIPYYLVDAVVLAPFGCYPGSVPGRYAGDFENVFEFAAAQMQGTIDQYLDKYVYSVGSHEEMLEKRVGAAKLMKLMQEETVREGYND
jgi:acyl CoA:acetate/3-ketoacid CoA transferase alpha subunit